MVRFVREALAERGYHSQYLKVTYPMQLRIQLLNVARCRRRIICVICDEWKSFAQIKHNAQIYLLARLDSFQETLWSPYIGVITPDRQKPASHIAVM